MNDDFDNNKNHNDNANPDATAIDEVKDEQSFFHMTTRFKWVLALSIVILLLVGVLIYSVYHDALQVEIWQLAIWGVCGVLAIYSVVKKSLAAMLLNLILFFVVSLIPVWQSAHENFQAVFELFFG